MNDEKYKEKERERSRRLFEFVKDEIRNMWVDARFDFTEKILLHLKPEIDEMARKSESRT